MITNNQIGTIALISLLMGIVYFASTTNLLWNTGFVCGLGVFTVIGIVVVRNL